MDEENWQEIYTSGDNWYERFISKVKVIYDRSFPLVQVSRKRMKDKICITKGLRKSIKTKQKLYRDSLNSNDLILVNIYIKIY